MMQEPSIVMLLMSAITILGGVIVYLALYIRKLHGKQMEMAIEFTETAQSLVSAINANTKMSDDLHRIIIQTLSKK